MDRTSDKFEMKVKISNKRVKLMKTKCENGTFYFQIKGAIIGKSSIKILDFKNNVLKHFCRNYE